MKKLLTKLAVSAATLGFASCALANPFTIHNNTNFYITSIINGGPCSNIFGKEGTTNPHSTSKINEATAKIACMINQQHCKVKVFLTKNCTGAPAGVVDYNVKTGINGITHESNSPVTISGNGFVATVD